MPSPVAELLRRMNTQTLEALSAAHSVQQGPESGRSRENAIRSFLRPLLPEGVGISTGFVLDAGGQVSGQQDIIIYRRDYHPVFLVNDIGYFLAEAVIAVIQVRARISSREALRSAMENVVSVKGLDRTAGGINYVVIGGSKGPPFHQDVFNHQIFAAIVTEVSLADGSSVLAAWKEFIDPLPRQQWPNLYADVNRFTIKYMEAETHPTMDPQKAKTVAWSSATAESPPLVILATSLINLIRIVPLIDYPVYAYWPPQQFGPGMSMPLSPDAPPPTPEQETS